MLAVSCTARYETYRFYSLSVVPPPPAAFTLPPPPASLPPPPAGGENRSIESGGELKNLNLCDVTVIIEWFYLYFTFLGRKRQQ